MGICIPKKTALRAPSLLSGRYRCPFVLLEAIASRCNGDGGGVAATFLEYSKTRKERGKGRHSRALSLLSSVFVARMQGRGGRPIKYVDHGGVWRLRMRAATARARGKGRTDCAKRGSGGEKEGTGRRAESGDERRVLGVRFVWCALPSR